MPGFTEDEELELLAEASLAAGREAMRFFRKDVEIWWKNEGTSPVTAADHAANDRLRDLLMGARPDYGWLSEESEDNSERLSKSHTFIVDPIDGTRAFMNGRETWAVSVALVAGGLPLAAALYAPALDELFLATRSGRVEKNGARPCVSTSDGSALFRMSAADDIVARLSEPTRGRLQRLGRIPSLAYRLAMIADGRLEATLVKPHAHDWDLAAADLILRNAGGMLTDLCGNMLEYNRPLPVHDVLVASNGRVHDELLSAFPDVR